MLLLLVFLLEKTNINSRNNRKIFIEKNKSSFLNVLINFVTL